MLEDTMERLTAALNANTEALGGKAPKGGAAARTALANGATVAAPKLTLEAVKAAVIAVKDAHGKPAAIKIIKEAGGVAELSAIKPARFAAVMAACEEIMGDGDGTEAEADDDAL